MGEGVAVVDWLAESVCDAVPVAVGDALGDPVPVELIDAVPLALGVAESERDGLPLGVRPPDGVPVALGEALPLGVELPEADCDDDGVADCVGVAEQAVFEPRRSAAPKEGAGAHDVVPGLRVHAPVTRPKSAAGAAAGEANHESPACVGGWGKGTRV